MLGLHCCCDCIFCTSDDFNRANADVTTGAPIPWVPSGVFSISGNQLVLDAAGNEALLLEQDIAIGETTSYKVTLGMVDWNNGDTIVLMMSWESAGNFYAACYTEIDGTTAELAIYWVVGTTAWTGIGTPPVDDWILLNSTLIPSLLTSSAPRAIECEISLSDGLMEMRTLSGGLPTSVDDAVIAYYTWNFGTKVGIATGWMEGDAHVDNFSLCENRCVTGCIIHTDNFNRADSYDVANEDHNWDESEEGVGVPWNIQILNNEVAWAASAPLWFGDPHPNGFTTMGVLVSGVTFSRTCSSGTCLVSAYDAKFIIYVAVDQIPSPTKYVKVTFDASLDTVTIRGVNTRGDPDVSELLATGSSSFGANQFYDLYVCVHHTGRVSAYAWNSEIPAGAPSGALTPIITTIETAGFLGGPYCGMRGEYQQNVLGGVTYTTWTSADGFIFARTYHPGFPKIIRWTVGGTVEVGDKFIVEITKDGITESYTVVTTETDVDLVAQEIVDAIGDLDPYLYYTLRSVQWYKEEGATGAFIATTESDFDANPSTTEGDNSAADGQTFAVETLQEFIQGDSRCPRCPPPCEDCAYCEGHSLPLHSAPSAVLVTVGSVAHPTGSYDPLDNECWARNQPGSPNTNDYGPPFPGVTDQTEDCSTGLGLCKAYNGSFVLEGCDCGYTYHTGLWEDYHYPDPPPYGGPPGTEEFSSGDPDIDSCFPGVSCGGFFVTAQIFDAGGGMRYWKVKYDDEATVIAIYNSAEFAADQCKVPRTLTWDEAIMGDRLLQYCVWPETIHLSPLD